MQPSLSKLSGYEEVLHTVQVQINEDLHVNSERHRQAVSPDQNAPQGGPLRGRRQEPM